MTEDQKHAIVHCAVECEYNLVSGAWFDARGYLATAADKFERAERWAVEALRIASS